MDMTIKQLADSLGVSKTAIRKRFTAEFRKKYVKTTENGTIIISENGCKLIAETMQTTAQEQITQLTENLHNTTIALSVAQSLHAGTIQKQITEQDSRSEREQEKKVGIWNRFFKRK